MILFARQMGKRWKTRMGKASCTKIGQKLRYCLCLVGQAELSVNQKARVLGFCTDRMTGREIAVDPLRFWLNVLVILFGGLLGLLILKVPSGTSS